MPPNINSPAPTDDAAIKGTDAGVKKPAPKKKIKNNGFKNKNARVALQKMHVFCEWPLPADWTGPLPADQACSDVVMAFLTLLNS